MVLEPGSGGPYQQSYGHVKLVPKITPFYNHQSVLKSPKTTNLIFHGLLIPIRQAVLLPLKIVNALYCETLNPCNLVDTGRILTKPVPIERSQ